MAATEYDIHPTKNFMHWMFGSEDVLNNFPLSKD